VTPDGQVASAIPAKMRTEAAAVLGEGVSPRTAFASDIATSGWT